RRLRRPPRDDGRVHPHARRLRRARARRLARRRDRLRARHARAESPGGTGATSRRAGPTRRESRSGGLALRREAEGLLERPLRHRADRRRLRLAAFEEDHERDRRDAVALRQVLLVVDVHLDELHAVLVGDPVEHGGDHVARATPFRPEVDEHLAVALEHLLLERLGCCRGCHSGPFGVLHVLTRAWDGFFPVATIETCSRRCRTSPIIPLWSTRCSPSGSASGRSSSAASGTGGTRSSRSWTGRSPRTRRPACTTAWAAR